MDISRIGGTAWSECSVGVGWRCGFAAVCGGERLRATGAWVGWVGWAWVGS